MSISEARKNGELVAIAESDLVREIDRLNGMDSDAINDAVVRLRRQLKLLKRGGAARTSEVRSIYASLDKLQFLPEVFLLVVDNKKDYIRASNGLTLNGVKYKRLLGTPGGIKMSTVFFISEGGCR